MDFLFFKEQKQQVMIQFNKQTENPFAGCKHCLTLFGSTYVDDSLLTKAYEEVKDNHEKKEMFYSLLFSIGDITNRNHNIFHNNKVDSGGQSRREDFYVIMNWMINNDYPQFKKFLFAGLFDEYTCFDHLFRTRVVTRKNTREISKVYTMLRMHPYVEDLSDYVVSIIKGNNPFKKHLVAKFLTIPRLGKRSKHNKMLSETYYGMRAKANFIKMVSDKVGWSYVYHQGYVNFTDYRHWRRQYNSDLESVLFSTNKISEFSEPEFIDWLDKLPSGARSRVVNRISNNEKWSKLRSYYNTWETLKLKAQEEQRILENNMRLGIASLEDEEKLKEIRKRAKVNTGGTNFLDLYQEIVRGTPDELKLEAFINKVNLPFNFLTIIDDSGSMRGAPFNFATFLASVLLCKNPNDSGRNLIGMFDSHCRFISTINKELPRNTGTRFRYTKASVKHISDEPFVVPEKSFYQNYLRIKNCLDAENNGGSTYVDSIGKEIVELSKKDPSVLDDIKQYPVWCIVSDGDFNNSYSAKSSVLELQEICIRELGFLPFIVLIEICTRTIIDATKFEGISQFMYVPGKIEIIEQILTNFLDVDVIDSYTPLLSIYRSNRYAPVRKNVI